MHMVASLLQNKPTYCNTQYWGLATKVFNAWLIRWLQTEKFFDTYEENRREGSHMWHQMVLLRSDVSKQHKANPPHPTTNKEII